MSGRRFRPVAVARLAGYYVTTLVRANLQVAWQVIRGPAGIRPAILRLPLEVDRAWLVVTLANLISLTPGTLTLDLDRDGRTLFVHVLRVTDVDRTRAQLRALERRLLEAFG